MANSPPPAPPPPSIPLAPGPIPVFKSKILDEPIPKSDLGEMGTDGVGIVGGQGVVDGGDPHVGMDGGGKKKQCKNLAGSGSSAGTLIPNIIKVSQVQVEERELHTGKKTRKLRLKKSNNNKGHIPVGSKSASPRLRSPMQVARSPGVNMLARSVASKRASLMVRSAALKRAKMKGSPETSKQSPSTMASPVPYLPHVSPSLEDLSPATTMTNSEASKRKRRKLISAIWKEAVPIYRDGKLVKGKCIHCRQVFAAARDTGTSSLKRHLKDNYKEGVYGCFR